MNQAIDLLNLLVNSFACTAIGSSPKEECIIIKDVLPFEIYSDTETESCSGIQSCNEYTSDSGHVYADLLPNGIYDNSDKTESEDTCSETCFDELLPPKIYLESTETSQNNIVYIGSNAAVITGPPIIDINGTKVMIVYPIPCQITNIFEDTQLEVRLSWPYNTVFQKLPRILVEINGNEVEKIENEYIKKMRCEDIGYESLKQINESVFQ